MIVAKIAEFVKTFKEWLIKNIDTVILVLVVILFTLFSFAAGYIMAKYQDRAPIIISDTNVPITP